MYLESGQVAVVTGASRGIGRAVAERFLERGVRVVLVARHAQGFDWARHHSATTIVTGDVAEESTSATMVAEALSVYGRLDAVVLNAGIASFGRLTELPDKDVARALDVNFFGVYFGLRHAIPVLRAQRSGAIVVTSSASSLNGQSQRWAYCAAKAAVNNLVWTAVTETGAFGIRVNAVCPGLIRTPTTEALAADPQRYRQSLQVIPQRRWGQPQEVAAVIEFLCSDAARYVNGAIVPVDGGRTANGSLLLLPERHTQVAPGISQSKNTD